MGRPKSRSNPATGPSRRRPAAPATTRASAAGAARARARTGVRAAAPGASAAAGAVRTRARAGLRAAAPNAPPASPASIWDTELFLQPADLYELASARIVRRGLSYARAERVTDIVTLDRRLEARVEGTRGEPYLVALEYDGEEILSSCSCPFDWEPFCKHAIAALAIQFGMAAREDTSGGPTDPRSATAAGSSGATGPAGGSDSAGRLEAEEIEVRRRRGAKAGFRVMCHEGDGYFGLFDVRSPSEKTYRVEIRSLAERVNRCSCRDYASAALGTCKHIEAVLTALRKRGGKRAFERAAAAPARVARVLVDRSDVPRIRLLLPSRVTPALADLAERFFDAEGFFRGDPVTDMAAFLNAVRRLRKVVLYADVAEFSQQLAAERRAEARAAQVRRQVLEMGTRIPGLKARLYPYQVEGSAFLAARGRALLGDDMGLGKTLQAIAATHLLRKRGEAHRALIVCPASLKHQWAAEIERFTGSECAVVQGGVTARLEQYRRQAPYTIVNYELMLRDLTGVADLAPDLLILDEAQRIRNWRTKTAEAIKTIETPHAFVLTGTPLQNRLDDLYSVMQVVDGRVLGPLWAYNERFVVRDERRTKISGYRNLDELRRRIAPVVLRRTKEEVALQLPERIDSRLAVDLTARQRELMDENVAVAARLAKIAEKRPLTPKEEKRLFMAMQNARMACNAAGLVDKETVGSPKLDEFEQILRDLCVDRGRKVLVFSEWETFCRMGAQRAERLGLGFARLHGAVPTHKRGGLIERFRDDQSCQVFFSTDAGGLGLNLQFASTMVNLELPWNPAVLDQRIGRIHRHGQTERVHVIRLVAEKSFEAGLELTLQSKRELFEAALDARSSAADVRAPSSCLAAVRAALVELESEQEAGQEPVFVEREGEPEDEHAEADAVATDPRSCAERLAGLLGPRLARVLELKSGQQVALVDRVDAATRSAAEQAGMTAIAAGTERALEALGADSIFVGARVLLDRSSDGPARRESGRDRCLAVARRKLAAAELLAAGDLGSEALGQAFAALGAVMRALAVDAGLAADAGLAVDAGLAADAAATNASADMDTDTDTLDGLPPVRLLYEVLVPRGLLTLEDAAKISRAEGLARAYAGLDPPAPAQVVDEVLADARRMVTKATGG